MFVLDFTLLLTPHVCAAQTTLAWNDPNNNPAAVGVYNLYYWQSDCDVPASVSVGDQTTYTRTGLEDGQTYRFTVTAHDGNGGRESVFSNEISKTFPASNNAPVANNGTLITTENTPASDTLSAADADGNALTFSLASNGSKGTVALTSTTTGACTYTPSPNASGSDTFSFRVSDGAAPSNVATVTVTITPVNDAPVATAQSVTTAANTLVNLTLRGSDVDGDALTFTIGTSPTRGTLSSTPPTVTYTPQCWRQG